MFNKRLILLIFLGIFFLSLISSANFGYSSDLPRLDRPIDTIVTNIINYINDTNSTDFWDNLDTPINILGSLITNDLGWIINTVNDLVNYYTKTEINNSFVPYSGATQNVDLGSQNITLNKIFSGSVPYDKSQLTCTTNNLSDTSRRCGLELNEQVWIFFEGDGEDGWQIIPNINIRG